MQKTLTSLALGLVLAATAQAHAATPLFFDDFNAEPLVLNGSLSQWTVSDGTIDVIGPGFFDLYPGNGRYVDLDGSSGNAGKITTKSSFSLAAGTTYFLSFDLGGSTRGDSNTVQVSLGGYSESITLASNAGLLHFERAISVQSDMVGALVFDHAGGDNLGLILDNVSVVAVPEPETYALMLAGLSLIGFAARHRASRHAS